MKLPLVSIIVPFYGVEKYIRKCASSLLEQVYPNLEYLFIDDASPDNSRKYLEGVIRKFPHRKTMVSIITHSVNKGLPAARNTGLHRARGAYIYHCDSDDWLEPTMIQDMVTAMEKNNADIVYTDFYLSFYKNERYMEQPSYQNSEGAIKAMLRGKMKFNVWNKLIKRELYDQSKLLFPEGHSMGEDMTMIQLFCHAQKIQHIPQAYYHYIQTNTNAFTKKHSPKQLADVQYNADRLITYLQTELDGKDLYQEIQFFKLNLKLPFLISLDKESYTLWNDWYPEANAYIKANPDFSFRSKLIQYAAQKKQYWFIYLYNLLIIKVVYGLIYR